MITAGSSGAFVTRSAFTQCTNVTRGAAKPELSKHSEGRLLFVRGSVRDALDDIQTPSWIRLNVRRAFQLTQ